MAPDSIDTMPPETFAACRDHGEPRVRIHDSLREAHAAFEALAELKIDEHGISLDLEREGARRFIDSCEKVINAIHVKVGPASRRINDSNQTHV